MMSEVAMSRSRRKTRREHRGPLLFQQLRIETPVDTLLVGGVMIGLERGDQSTQSRRKDNQIAGSVSGSVRVGYAGRDEYCHSRADGLGSIRISERQLSLQDVPGFVVGMVDVKRGWSAAAPLIDSK
jgi:hypothetical protein